MLLSTLWGRVCETLWSWSLQVGQLRSPETGYHFRDHIVREGEKFSSASLACTTEGMCIHTCHTNLRPSEVEKSIQGATGLLSNSEERTLLRDVLICDLEALWLWLMAFPSDPRAVPLHGVSASCPLSHLALSMVADVAVCREKLLVFILFFFGWISRSPSSDLVFIELIEGGD